MKGGREEDKRERLARVAELQGKLGSAGGGGRGGGGTKGRGAKRLGVGKSGQKNWRVGLIEDLH
jgi:hypothetical protein